MPASERDGGGEDARFPPWFVEDARSAGLGAHLREGVGVLQQIDRSIRASIASSHRRDRVVEESEDRRAENFHAHGEERLADFALRLGVSRANATAVLRWQLWEDCHPFLAYFHGYIALTNEFNRLAADRWRASGKTAVKLEVLRELHSQALLVSDEILGLLSIGYPAAGLARWRTLYELQTISLFVARSPASVAERYRGSHVVEQWKQLERAISERRLDRRLKDPEFQEDLRQLKAEFDRLVSTYGRPYSKQYGWAADRLGLQRVTFRDIEARVIEQRSLAYGAASQLIHGDRVASMRTLARYDDGYLLAPQYAELFAAHWDMIWSLFEITGEIASLVYLSQRNQDVLHWAQVVYAAALDAATEGNLLGIEVDHGFINRQMTLNGPDPDSD